MPREKPFDFGDTPLDKRRPEPRPEPRGAASEPGWRRLLTAVLGGMGRFHDRPVMVIGTEKGTDTDSRVKHNFGMARPE